MNKLSLMKVYSVPILSRTMQQVPLGKVFFFRISRIFLLFTWLSSEVRIVDKITDLPVNYSKYLNNRRPQTGQPRLSSSTGNLYDQYQQAPQQQLSQTEPPQQYRTTTYNYPG